MGTNSTLVFALLATIAGLPAVRAAEPSAPDGWRRETAPGAISGMGTYSLALPPTLETVPARGVDSVVSEYRSPTLTLLVELAPQGGQANEQCPETRHCTISRLRVAGIRGRRMLYHVPDPDGDLPWRATYVVSLGSASEPPRSMRFTVRAECRTVAACDLADRIVRTIRFVPKP